MRSMRNKDEARNVCEVVCLSAKKDAETADYDPTKILDKRTELAAKLESLSTQIQQVVDLASNADQFPTEQYEKFLKAFRLKAFGKLQGEAEFISLLSELVNIKISSSFYPRGYAQVVALNCVTLIYYMGTAGSSIAWAILSAIRDVSPYSTAENDSLKIALSIQQMLTLTGFWASTIDLSTVLPRKELCEAKKANCLTQLGKTRHNPVDSVQVVSDVAADLAACHVGTAEGEAEKLSSAYSPMFDATSDIYTSHAWRLILFVIASTRNSNELADITGVGAVLEARRFWFAAISPKEIRDQGPIHQPSQFSSALKDSLKSKMMLLALYSLDGDTSFSYHFGKHILVSLNCVLSQCARRESVLCDTAEYTAAQKLKDNEVEVKHLESAGLHKVMKFVKVSAIELQARQLNLVAEKILTMLYQTLVFNKALETCAEYISPILEAMLQGKYFQDSLGFEELLLSYLINIAPMLTKKIASFAFPASANLNTYARFFLAVARKDSRVLNQDVEVSSIQIVKGVIADILDENLGRNSDRFVPSNPFNTIISLSSNLGSFTSEEEVLRGDLEKINTLLYQLDSMSDTSSSEADVVALNYKFVDSLKSIANRLLDKQNTLCVDEVCPNEDSARSSIFSVVSLLGSQASSKTVAFTFEDAQKELDQAVSVFKSSTLEENTLEKFLPLLSSLKETVASLLSALFEVNSAGEILILLLDNFSSGNLKMMVLENSIASTEFNRAKPEVVKGTDFIDTLSRAYDQRYSERFLRRADYLLAGPLSSTCTLEMALSLSDWISIKDGASTEPVETLEDSARKKLALQQIAAKQSPVNFYPARPMEVPDLSIYDDDDDGYYF